MRKKKLEKMIIKEEETRRQVENLLEYIEKLKIGQKEEAETELIRAVRGKKFDSRDLLRIIKGIENDRIRIEDEEANEEEEKENASEDSEEEDTNQFEENAWESEDFNNTERGVNGEDETEGM